MPIGFLADPVAFVTICVPPCLQIGHDHLLAAWTATIKQRKVQTDAKAAGMSEESYLKAIGEYPCTEYAERPVFDEMDADYMRAAHYATRRQREREAAEEAQEAAAIKAGYTVEEWEAIRGGAFVL